MKIRRMAKFMSLIIVFSFLLAALIGCGTVTKYTVTVTGGTGGGEFESGTECTVIATVPAGNEFVNWTIEDKEVSKTSTYTFNVTKDVSIKANFKVTEAAVYTIAVGSITNGTVTANKTSAPAGDTVVLTVTPDTGYQLKDGTLKFNTTEVTGTTFIMPAANVTITAEFELLPEGIYSITVGALTNGAVISDKNTGKEGDTVTLTVTPDNGYQLKEGTLKFNAIAVTGTTFAMPAEDVTITAEFEAKAYTLTVTDGTYTGTPKYGEEITLTPDTIANKAFREWTVVSGGITIIAGKFTMPAQDVSVRAEYVDLLQKIATPDNSASKLFYLSSDGNHIEIDRAATMFTDATAYVKVNVFADYGDGVDATPVGSLKMTRDKEMDGKNDAGDITTMDGEKSIKINGQPANYYINKDMFGKFHDILKYLHGYSYSESATYYFSCQIIAVSDPVEVDGFDITYSDSDESVVNTVGGICKDATKPAGLFDVSAASGYIDKAGQTNLKAGYGVSLTFVADEPAEGFLFVGWKNADDEFVSDAASFTTTVNGALALTAVYEEETSIETYTLSTPYADSAANRELVRLNGTAFAEFDRLKSGETGGDMLFSEPVDYVLMYIYDAQDAVTPAGTLKIIHDGEGEDGSIITSDETARILMEGMPGNMFVNNVSNFWTIIKAELGVAYKADTTYYFAVKKIAKTGLVEGAYYSDSAVSEIGWGLVEDAANSDTHNVTVTDGIIKGTNETSIVVGNGAYVTFIAETRSGFIFAGWYDESEKLVSNENTLLCTVTADISLKAKYVDENTVPAQITLDTPDNSADEFLFFESSPVDGFGGITFVKKDYLGQAGLSHLEYSVYENGEVVGTFILKLDVGGNPVLSQAEGTNPYLQEIRERTSDKRLTGSWGNVHNWLKTVIIDYSDAKKYTFAARAVAVDTPIIIEGVYTIYVSSGIGAVGSPRTTI